MLKSQSEAENCVDRQNERAGNPVVDRRISEAAVPLRRCAGDGAARRVSPAEAGGRRRANTRSCCSTVVESSFPRRSSPSFFATTRIAILFRYCSPSARRTDSPSRNPAGSELVTLPRKNDSCPRVGPSGIAGTTLPRVHYFERAPVPPGTLRPLTKSGRYLRDVSHCCRAV